MAEVLEKVPYLHKKFECASDCCAQHHIFSRFTLWQSKIYMENVPFIDDLAFTICLQWSFSIATCRITRGSSSSFRESSRHFRFLPRYSKMAWHIQQPRRYRQVKDQILPRMLQLLGSAAPKVKVQAGGWRFPWGYPNSWMVYFIENPYENGWFGGTPVLGHPHTIWCRVCKMSMSRGMSQPNPQVLMGLSRIFEIFDKNTPRCPSRGGWSSVCLSGKDVLSHQATQNQQSQQSWLLFQRLAQSFFHHKATNWSLF